MLAARLLKTVDEHRLGRIHKQNFIRLALRLQRFERAEKRLKKLAAAGIRDDRHAALNTLGFIAKIVKDRNERRGQIIDTIKADILHPAYIFVNPSFVKLAHKLGFKVNVWTVNEPSAVRYLVSCGVDGIITDCPGRTREIIDVCEGRKKKDESENAKELQSCHI